MIPHKQLSLEEIFSDCQEKFENLKMTNLNFFPYCKIPLTSKSSFLFLLDIIFMNQQEDLANTHFMQ